MKWILVGLFGIFFSPNSFGVMNACEESSDALNANRSKLPAHIQSLLCKKLGLPKGAPDTYIGPNCFTGVLLWFEPQQPLELASEDDLMALIAKFRPIERSQLKNGDVIVFERRLEDQKWITHTAVYLENGVVWNKLGPSKFYSSGDGSAAFAEPDWTLTSLDELENLYDVAIPKFYRKN